MVADNGIEIERSRHAQQFVVIGNAQARDARISFRARGVHHYLLSLPSGWRTTSAKMADETTEGRDAVRAALNELERAGYVKRHKVQGDDGRWRTRMAVYDTPQPVDNPASPAPENPSSVRPGKTRVSAGRTEDGKPGVGFPGVYKKDGDEHGREDGFDLPCVAPSTSVASTGRDVSDSQERNHLEDPAPLAATLASFTAPRDPANAEKNKMLTAFATGGLAKARSDVTNLRPSSTRFADLCKLHFLPPSECARVGLPHDPPRSARPTELAHAA